MATERAKRDAEVNGWEKLSNIAFTLALGLVIARGMLLEVIREASDVMPGQELVLRSPGAAVTVLLDLLCYLPAMLVAARAVFDGRFRLRWSITALIMAVVGVMAVASIFWSADRFAAATSAGKLLAGSAVLWTMVQTVRDWVRFRTVCALLVGLLAMNITQGLVHANIDLPETQQNWEQNREKTFAEKGIEPGSFQAMQFDKKVMAGELMGFNASTNSLAALVVMISMLLIGDLFSRWRSGQFGMLIAPLILLVLAGWVIWKTDSTTAFLSPFLGVALIAVGWRFRGALASWRRTAFAAGVAGLLAIWAAVIAHGLYHGSLFHRSITFRWQYWVASFQLFIDHFWRGVGWENFSSYYLQYRLPVAPEEIRDPHNLFVRFATELGILGLLLACGWVAAIVWETTLPQTLHSPKADSAASRGIRPIVAVVLLAIVLSILAQVDFRHEGAFVLEAFRRGVFAAVMIGAAAVFCAVDYRDMRIADSPAPLLSIALLAGLALFLVHNQIDFAMFETGPFYVFVAAAGSLIGMRMSLRDTASPGAARAGLLAGAGWTTALIATGILIAAPVVMGEASAREADDEVAAKRFASAASLLQDAYDDSAWLHNADYPLRKGRVELYAGQQPEKVLSALQEAARANPRSISTRMATADVQMRAGDHQASREQYAIAIALNPTDIGIRLEAARAFEQMQMRDNARQQYAKALELNASLPEDEAERLSPQRVEEIQSKIDTLGPAAPPAK